LNFASGRGDMGSLHASITIQVERGPDEQWSTESTEVHKAAAVISR
jgi:hypothetical protein